MLYQTHSCNILESFAAKEAMTLDFLWNMIFVKFTMAMLDMCLHEKVHYAHRSWILQNQICEKLCWTAVIWHPSLLCLERVAFNAWGTKSKVNHETNKEVLKLGMMWKYTLNSLWEFGLCGNWPTRPLLAQSRSIPRHMIWLDYLYQGCTDAFLIHVRIRALMESVVYT